MSDPAVIVLAISSLFPSFARSESVRRQVIERVDLISRECDAEGIERCAIPHAIAFVESGYRARNPRAPLAGCKPYSTDDAAQARCEARAWRFALRRCRTVQRALARYQFGQCAVPRGRRFRRQRAATSRYVARVMRVARAIDRRSR